MGVTISVRFTIRQKSPTTNPTPQTPTATNNRNVERGLAAVESQNLTRSELTQLANEIDDRVEALERQEERARVSERCAEVAPCFATVRRLVRALEKNGATEELQQEFACRALHRCLYGSVGNGFDERVEAVEREEERARSVAERGAEVAPCFAKVRRMMGALEKAGWCEEHREEFGSQALRRCLDGPGGDA